MMLMCCVMLLLVYVLFDVCHKIPGTLQVVKVTALICVTSISLKVDDPPWC